MVPPEIGPIVTYATVLFSCFVVFSSSFRQESWYEEMIDMIQSKWIRRRYGEVDFFAEVYQHPFYGKYYALHLSIPFEKYLNILFHNKIKYTLYGDLDLEHVLLRRQRDEVFDLLVLYTRSMRVQVHFQNFQFHPPMPRKLRRSNQ